TRASVILRRPSVAAVTVTDAAAETATCAHVRQQPAAASSQSSGDRPVSPHLPVRRAEVDVADSWIAADARVSSSAIPDTPRPERILAPAIHAASSFTPDLPLVLGTAPSRAA